MRISARGPVVARMSVLPHSRLWPCDDDPCAADASVRQLAAAGRAALEDPVFREALHLASPSLFEAAQQLAQGEIGSPREARRALLSLLRYHLRMAGRAAPFGLFAGVAPVGEGPTEAKVGDGHRKAVRPDAAWLREVLTAREADPRLMEGLQARAHPLSEVRDDRLVLPLQGGRSETSVRNTAAVALVLRAAESPVVLAEVVDRLHAACPEKPRALAEGMVRSLVTHGFLLTELHPPMRSVSPLDHALDRLEKLAPDAEPVRALRALRETMADYASSPIGQDPRRPRAVVHGMRQVQDSAQYLHVDVALDARITLPRAVADEAARAVGALWGITPPGRPFPGLDTYTRRFTERYGSARLVPLAEVVDPERGLGPLPEEDDATEPSARLPLRNAALAELAASAVRDGRAEVVLDRRWLDRLAVGGKGIPPASMDVLATLSAASPQAVDVGEFLLVLGSGSHQAGAFNGRFAPLLGDPVAAHCRREARRCIPGTPHVVRVALDFSPRAHRSQNVARTGTHGMPTVHIGTFHPQEPDRLGVRDLYVGCRHDRLYLYSRALGREVLPASLDMLNTKQEHPAVRLLHAIGATAGRTGLHMWSWGPALDLPRLPRVRYGRTVLSPARWNSRLLSPEGGTWDEWRAQVEAWRAAWDVPDRIYIGTGDQRLPLDLRKPMHLRLLREELRRAPQSSLHEAIGLTEETSGWLGGTPRACELVIPLHADGTAEPVPAPTSRRRYPSLAPDAPPHPHGAAWLSAKLYASRARHNEILTRHLPRLLGEVSDSTDRWFFLRYTDPDPHLRLRFRPRPGVTTGELLPALGSWAADLRERGLARTLLLDEYTPETNRYGGPDVIEAAEAAFHADSLAVLEQLQVLADPAFPLDTTVLSCLGYLDLAHVFTGSAEALSTLPGPRPHPDRAALRRQRALIAPLAEAPPDWKALYQVPGGERIVRSWHERAAVFTAYGEALRATGCDISETLPRVLMSLMHMHHNRLASGAQREKESLALLRDLLHSRHARKHQKDPGDR